MRQIQGWCAVGFALALGGCAVAADREQRSVFYAPHLVQYAAREGTFPVIIRGNPFGSADAAADAAIAELLRLPSWSTPARFVPVSDGTGLHFVLVFDPAHRGTSGGAVGRDSSAVPLAAVAGETAVLGVFCQTNEALSVAVSVGPAVRGADDPVLRDLFDRVTGRVFAHVYPARQGSVF